MTTRIIMSPERRDELRLDVAARERALSANSVSYATRHAPALLDAAHRTLRPGAVAALRDALRMIADGERWSDAVARRMREALAPVRRAAGTGIANPDAADSLAWHATRLGELLAEYEALRHRATMLAMASTDRSAIRRSSARAHRIRDALRRRDPRPQAPAA
jgi:hypothetical protein